MAKQANYKQTKSIIFSNSNNRMVYSVCLANLWPEKTFNATNILMTVRFAITKQNRENYENHDKKKYTTPTTTYLPYYLICVISYFRSTQMVWCRWH